MCITGCNRSRLISKLPIKGVAAFRRHFTITVPDAIRQEVLAEMEAAADEHVEVMRRFVPVEEGKLRDSIGWTWGDPPDGALVVASANAQDGNVITIYAGNSQTIVTNSRGIEFQNAFIQEFGREGKHATPFFYRTLRALNRRTTGRMTRALTRAIKTYG